MQDRVRLALIIALLGIFFFGLGFMFGRHYEREQGNYIDFRLNDGGLTIESRQDGERVRLK